MFFGCPVRVRLSGSKVWRMLRLSSPRVGYGAPDDEPHVGRAGVVLPGGLEAARRLDQRLPLRPAKALGGACSDAGQ